MLKSVKFDNLSLEDFDLDKLPDPKGYRMLIAVPTLQQRSAGGIIMPESTRDDSKVSAITGLVLKKGIDAYNADKFSDPWCEVGDWILMKSYSGSRIQVDGYDCDFRIVNDDTVEAVVRDPNSIKRAL